METGATQSGNYKPASGQKIKGRAPQPPKQPPIARDVKEHKVIPTLGMWSNQNILTVKGNQIKTTVEILVVFPNGEEQKHTIHGSKPVMDLFVELCSQYHLNPAIYTFELKSGETQQSLSYKPNTLIGTLEVQKILLKLKVPEEKKFKRPPPKIPEKTVRLVVNYLKTQKTVVRVNPEVPLQNIIPIICEKCEVSQECIVLLKDNFTGEKLELTKSLNDLGIKELYVCDNTQAPPSKTHSEPTVNYRETSLSSGYDISVKEKKGFLGFFRTSKKNKFQAEKSSRRSLDLGSGEFLKSTFRKQSLDETMIADSSRNLCSVMVTPSLSHGSSQGATAKVEMKKRRAPPVPVIPPFSGGKAEREEKMPSPLPQSSLQHEIKKKKRPAPPPPTYKTLNRFEENKRQSTIGNEQQVPQKPPRGNIRDPPQLVIPPPPSYPPPPDKDTLDPAALYNEADVTDPTQLVSKRNVQLSHTYKEDTIEETNSFSSCPKCNKTTNLFPVIVSRAFQNDGINSRNKSIVEKTSAEIHPILFAKGCSVNNASFKNDKSENIKQRADGRMMETKIENTDKFMVAGVQKVQLARDKSLAVTENIRNDPKSQSVVFEMKGASSPLPQKAENPSDVSFPVPVTIIDEFPENNTITHSNKEEEKDLFSTIETSENTPVKLTDLVKFFDTNKNIETVSKKCVGTSSYSPKNLSQKFSTGNIYENVIDELNKSHPKLKALSAKNSDEEESDPTQFPWRRSSNNRSKIYRSKTGLTTFTVVPPKPKMRDVNRNQSPYTGAIKIDELGNLVKPNDGHARKIIVDASSKVNVFGGDKECKRSNTTEKQTEGLPLDHSIETEITINSKQPNKMSITEPDCIRKTTWPIVGSHSENIVGPVETKVPSNTSQFSGKTVLASVISRKDFVLQMPPKQSSKDYLTTTVANSNDLTQFETIQGKHYEELNKTEGKKTEMEPFSKGCTVAAKYCPMETEPGKTQKLYSSTFSKNVSNTTPSCADPRVSNIKTQKQNKSTNSISGTSTIITSNKNSISEQELIHDLVQDVTDREITFAVIKKPSDQVSSPFFLSKPNADSSATIFSSHMKSSNLPSATIVNQTTLEKDENLGKAESKLCSNRIEDSIYNIFGPKKKFKSVIQKPLPKNTSAHSALMEAIKNSAGKDKLRKISHSTVSGSPKESKFMETEAERSALLASIRGHSGVSVLRKVSSFASAELQRFRNAEEVLKNKSNSTKEQQYGPPPPPPLPLSHAQLRMKKTHSLPRMTDSPGNSRQALMEAIRSGAGKAHLRKVPLCEN
ncbi:PREDICTED: protein cordon-bleu-like [Thamnophis sirtalis]|uniref:Protein cordon-bleu-like n=1 Tax=Thamnophis sirtalis TaxID=35019 RepID=A0A6I9XT26_9SAUR|nr:PREDICTED: protein cordon-bleu-like [Thamnophis sirtalis]